MASLLLFLNEMSWSFEGVHRNAWEEHICECIRAAGVIRTIRSDVVLTADREPGSILVGSGENQLPLGAVIGGGRFEDEWSLLRDIFQTYPSEVCPENRRPQDAERVIWKEVETEGMSWAHKADTFVLSFGYPDDWHAHEIRARIKRPAEVRIRNIAKPDHVGAWRQKVEESGLDLAESSLVYECSNFAVRMYLNDHNPPHVHVFRNAGSRDLVARVNIRTVEVMEGTRNVLPIRAELVEWMRRHSVALVKNWTRCREGRLPERIA